MNFEESIQWLFNQFPAYQHVGVSAYKPDLQNVQQLCDYFQVAYPKLKFIHVAGTNGKGSTCNYLASILQESGYKTGLFTSPHILDFRERIRVNGEMISKEKVLDFCLKIQNSNSGNDQLKLKPSFFEITWVLALIHFIDEQCDICVIETGLGGRLDATNIIHPLVSIITSISLDHTSILGNSIEKIAFEKAGIIKNDVPVVLGELPEKALQVMLQKAEKENSEMHFAESINTEKSIFPIDSYLHKNELLVRKSCEVLNNIGFSIPEPAIENGIRNVNKRTGFLGRFQQISATPPIIVDAAHNVDGIRELLKLVESTYPSKKLLVIYGASNDKNVTEIIDLFPTDSYFLLTCFSNQRSLNVDELQQLSDSMKQSCSIFPDIAEAFEYGKRAQNEEHLLLITGSFFLLSDFFSFFK